jgi:hypothetical protein
MMAQDVETSSRHHTTMMHLFRILLKRVQKLRECRSSYYAAHHRRNHLAISFTANNIKDYEHLRPMATLRCMNYE